MTHTFRVLGLMLALLLHAACCQVTAICDSSSISVSAESIRAAMSTIATPCGDTVLQGVSGWRLEVDAGSYSGIYWCQILFNDNGSSAYKFIAKGNVNISCNGSWGWRWLPQRSASSAFVITGTSNGVNIGSWTFFDAALSLLAAGAAPTRSTVLIEDTNFLCNRIPGAVQFRLTGVSWISSFNNVAFINTQTAALVTGGGIMQVDMSKVTFRDNEVDVRCAGTSAEALSAIRISSFLSVSQPALIVDRCSSCNVIAPYGNRSDNCDDTARQPSDKTGFYSCGFGVTPQPTRSPVVVPVPAWLSNVEPAQLWEGSGWNLAFLMIVVALMFGLLCAGIMYLMLPDKLSRDEPPSSSSQLEEPSSSGIQMVSLSPERATT